jgi:hypothetical protein
VHVHPTYTDPHLNSRPCRCTHASWLYVCMASQTFWQSFKYIHVSWGRPAPAPPMSTYTITASHIRRSIYTHVMSHTPSPTPISHTSLMHYASHTLTYVPRLRLHDIHHLLPLLHAHLCMRLTHASRPAVKNDLGLVPVFGSTSGFTRSHHHLCVSPSHSLWSWGSVMRYVFDADVVRMPFYVTCLTAICVRSRRVLLPAWCA